MKNRGRILMTCAVTICMALCLTACDPKEKIDEFLTPTSVEEAMAAKAAEANQLLSTPSIVEDGYLTVGLRTAETTAPFCITQASGEVMGIDIDLASMLADSLGLKVRFVNVTNVEAALGTQCDIVMHVGYGEAGSATVVGAYAESGTAIFCVGDASGITAEDLAERTVGLQTGSVSQRLVAQNDLRMYEVSYDNLNEAFAGLAAGDVEFVCCDLYSGAYLAAFYPDVNLVGTIDVPTAEGIAVAAGNTAVQVQIQSAVDNIQTNGQGELMRIKWIGGMPNATAATQIEGIE